MADGPDVRALRYLLGPGWDMGTPASCLGCPFSVRGRPRGCDLLGMAEVDHGRPPCVPEDWQAQARLELRLLEADSALLAAVASDAREESLLYRRGLAEGAAAGREACCKAVCPDCAAGDPGRSEDGAWFHRAGTQPLMRRRCRADAIRRRADGDGR